MEKKQIGVLAVQGAFAEHIAMVRKLGAEAFEIRQLPDLEGGTPCFATMDVSAVRNAYGRQLGSFYTEAEFAGLGTIPMTFIRAPYIASLQENVKVLATVDGKIVAARQGNQFATAFHPELNEDVTVHRYFLEEVCKGN